MATAQEMVAQIETALAEQPAGVVSITVDGTSVTYKRAELLHEYEFWKRQLAKEQNTRPNSGSINLGGMW